MAKKPRLEIVGSTTNPSAPPRTLGKAGRSVWQSIMSEYQIADSSGLAILLQIAGAYDRLAECAEIIAREGPVVRTKSGPKEHPLLRTELGCSSFIIRAVHRLGLDVEPVKAIGRPPRVYGWSPDDADQPNTAPPPRQGRPVDTRSNRRLACV